ncbi:hypothetical protein J2S00_003522 [Caldalkalibacillus uzonensis]|uniref:ABC transporter permease n=1 Tax=Caldalkalibacillus uzonensis TaxID=353224 RepID=A0ABU0CXB2_9BACI|nr:hypothetical protein [Caldalkalibacillus uzonensis]MDQ0340696.1 hypothetical protein [Caldalkalibacillus uzonensis]
MPNLKPVLKLYMLDIKHSYVIFWSILCAVSVLSFVLAVSMPDITFGVSSNFAVYIYLSISGFLMVKETLPYILGMNITRYHYYWGIVVGSLGLVVLSAISLSAYVWFFGLLARWFDLSDRFNVTFIMSNAFMDNEMLTMFSLDLVIGLFLFSLFGLAGAAYYRFGWIPLMTAVVVWMAVIMTPFLRAPLIRLFEWVFVDPVSHISMLCLSLSVFFFGTLWLVIRRATIHPANRQ